MADDTFALSLENAEPSDAVFEAIRDAVMETARGRWFLAEYARRNRHADTETLLAALSRIESLIHARQDDRPAPLPAPANPLPIKPQAEAEGKAAGRVLAEAAASLRAAIEPVRDLAWHLRERGDARCELMDIRADEIAQTCELFEALQRELDGRNIPPDLSFLEPGAAIPRATAPAGIPAPSPVTRGTDTRSRPGLPAAEPPTAISPPDDADDPMPGIIAAAQRMAEAAAPPATAPAPAAPEPAPVAGPRGSNGGEQAVPRVSPSTRLKGLFNELHQARWGSQENPAEPERAEPGARSGPPASSPAELWPRATSRADAAPALSVGVAERAPAAARLPEHEAFSPVAALSEEERIALFS
ncbi:MAG TPA: hypothetical protein VHA55_13220 [Pseudorhodoplanes sp.]|jgi:hypothetical protein|nr:hypothetical protein [Pseudorhodoplanes sp.]